MIEFTNEKGNVKVKTRNELRNAILSRLMDVFDGCPRQKNEGGAFSFVIGTDSRTGQEVWAHLGLTVNMKEPYHRNAATEPIQIPQLFD